MDTEKTELMFVYNADSTFFAVANDFLKKIVAPQTQECNLCTVTHGAFTPKEKWRDFLATLPQEKVFLHRDEFRSIYPDKTNTNLPAILSKRNGIVSQVATAEEINEAKTIPDLIALITDRVHSNTQ